MLAERGGEHRFVGLGLELALRREEPDLHPPIIAANRKRPRIFRCGVL